MVSATSAPSDLFRSASTSPHPPHHPPSEPPTPACCPDPTAPATGCDANSISPPPHCRSECSAEAPQSPRQTVSSSEIFPCNGLPASTAPPRLSRPRAHPGSAPRQISFQSQPTPRLFHFGTRKTPRSTSRLHLDSRRLRRRSPLRRNPRSPPEGLLPPTPARRLHHHPHRLRPRQRAHAFRRRRNLFPPRLGLQRSPRSQRRQTRHRHHPRNRNLAQLPPRIREPQNPCPLC